MFQFGRFPTYSYVFTACSLILHQGGFPIRISAGRSLFAAHRSFSQLVTSFVGSWCQGIPLMLFLAWTLLYNHLWLYLVLSIALNCWVSLQLLIYFALAKLFFYPFFGKTLISDSSVSNVFFPLLNIKSVRVLNLLLFGFQWTLRLAPDLLRSFNQSSNWLIKWL